MRSLKLITPQAAVALLLTCPPNNRPAHAAIVEQYAQAMRHGTWLPLLDRPIELDQTGQLLNGVHRLHAIVLSGETIEIAVEKP